MMSTEPPADPVLAPNWRHVGAFLGLTFGLSWLLNLIMVLRGGLAAPGTLTALQLQMMLPAFSAIVLGLWAFPENPLHRSRPAGPARWFFYYFILITGIYVLIVVAGWLAPPQGTVATITALLPQVLALIGLIFLLVLRRVAGREASARLWLSWGHWRDWLLFGVAIIAYYVLQAALNALTGLGGSTLAPPETPPGMSPTAFLILGVVQSVILGPILAVVIAFGEEYGWRGYLQTELFKLGRRKGVLLLGVIWGIWHWPVILMGYNYPGRPLLGILLMTLYTVGLAVVLGYAVLRSRSVLLASYLHALNNQVLAFIFIIGFSPSDPILSFGIGIYGIATLAVIALLILRDPIWRGTTSSLP